MCHTRSVTNSVTSRKAFVLVCSAGYRLEECASTPPSPLAAPGHEDVVLAVVTKGKIHRVVEAHIGDALEDFVRLRTPEECLKFATRWGLPDRGFIVNPRSLRNGLKGPRPLLPGCEVLRMLGVASGMRLARTLDRAARNPKGGPVTVDWRTSQSVVVRVSSAVSIRPGLDLSMRRFDETEFRRYGWRHHERAGPIRAFAAEIIGAGMAEVRVGLRISPGGYALEAKPANMFAALWLELAGQLARGLPLTPCAHCGGLFNPARADQTAHPRCAAAARARRYRVRRAGLHGSRTVEQ